MANVEKRLAEIKAYKDELYAALDQKYPEMCDEWEDGEKAIIKETDELERIALNDWTKSADYANFQARQAARRRSRMS